LKIAIGNDHVGLDLKIMLESYFKSHKINFVHFGTSTSNRMDYPEVAFKLSEAVALGEFESGILICGTGIGMSISANKVKGIRSVVCSEPYSAKMAIEHNNANILCLGSRVIGSEMAMMILDSWFGSTYEAGRHQKRVDMINGYTGGKS